MKKIIFIFSIIFLFACGETEVENANFLNAYKEVLMIREAFPDTNVANTKINAVLSKYGYNMDTFAKEYYELAKNRENFITLLDSLRQSVNRESDSLKSHGQ